MATNKQDAYDLIPASIVPQIPRLYATEHQPEPTAYVKLFTPDGSWTWYVAEYDPGQRLCFGLVYGHVPDLGYFSLDEIEKVRGPLGLRVERDLAFTPRPLSQCHNPCVPQGSVQAPDKPEGEQR